MVRRISGLDDIARIFFPDNRNHRRAFVGLWLEIKYAENQFLPSSMNLAERYSVSARALDVVRAKLRKMGLIMRVSHFNPSFGHQSGWTFSSGFYRVLSGLSGALHMACRRPTGRIDEQKDRASILYI
jgi:hypothetical protein